MARKQSGGFNKILNFIGLVDDEDPRDTYGEEYQSDNYGRQQAYVPSNSNSRNNRRNTNTRSNAQSQPAQRRSLPAASSNRYDERAPRSSRASAGYDDYRSSSRRTSSRFAEDDYNPRPERSNSRFDYVEDEPQIDMPSRNQSPARVPRTNRRSRTVMLSLHRLEDCCEVIDNLIANNTVVLTMDELDGNMIQRAVDTLSGAVFALRAGIRKASDKTYLVTPASVEVNETYDVDRRF